MHKKLISPLLVAALLTACGGSDKSSSGNSSSGSQQSTTTQSSSSTNQGTDTNTSTNTSTGNNTSTDTSTNTGSQTTPDNPGISRFACTSTISNTVGYYFKGREEGNLVGIVTPYGLGVVYDLAKDAKQTFAGCLSETGNNLAGNEATRYGNDGKFASGGNLSATVSSPGLELAGAFTDSAGGSRLFGGMPYNTELSDLPASLAAVAGHYVYKDGAGTVVVDAQISTAGDLTLVASGCTYTGPITIPDQTLNLYRLADIKSTCASKPEQTDALGLIARLVFPKEGGGTQEAIFLGYINNAKSIPMLLLKTQS